MYANNHEDLTTKLQINSKLVDDNSEKTNRLSKQH